ncbi:MAG: DUF2520 domain-containing protein [Muribaculaceae bacterium]|nr:DUF2520 domain-containing protein [Muribaculaceae bacterium]
MKSFDGNVVIVGAGNVATHLSRALAKSLKAVISRKLDHARALALPIGVDAYDDFAVIERLKPDFIIISIADNGICDVVDSIGHLTYEPIVVHTSGTVPKEILSPISSRIGVLYPLQTFSAGSAVDVSSVPFFTEATNAADWEVVDSVAALLSPRVWHADAEHRRALHIAGVFTSNFTNILLEKVEQVLTGAGYSLDIVQPLMQATVDKAFAIGPHNAQTGPARRGDFDVLKAQYEALPDDLKPAYAALTKLILESHNISHE